MKDGQTLADIAIQEYGSLEALPALAAANAIGMTDTLEAGSRLQLPDVSFNRLIQQYCKANDVSPATERGMTDVKLRYSVVSSLHSSIKVNKIWLVV